MVSDLLKKIMRNDKERLTSVRLTAVLALSRELRWAQRTVFFLEFIFLLFPADEKFFFLQISLIEFPRLFHRILLCLVLTEISQLMPFLTRGGLSTGNRQSLLFLVESVMVGRGLSGGGLAAWEDDQIFMSHLIFDSKNQKTQRNCTILIKL